MHHTGEIQTACTFPRWGSGAGVREQTVSNTPVSSNAPSPTLVPIFPGNAVPASVRSLRDSIVASSATLKYHPERGYRGSQEDSIDRDAFGNTLRTFNSRTGTYRGMRKSSNKASSLTDTSGTD